MGQSKSAAARLRPVNPNRFFGFPLASEPAKRLGVRLRSEAQLPLSAGSLANEFIGGRLSVPRGKQWKATRTPRRSAGSVKQCGFDLQHLQLIGIVDLFPRFGT